MADQSFEEQEILDLQDPDTPAIFRKENDAFRKTFHVGGRDHNKEGGSTGKTHPDKYINPKAATIPMNPVQITSRDSLQKGTEPDSYTDNLNVDLNKLKTVVKADDFDKS